MSFSREWPFSANSLALSLPNRAHVPRGKVFQPRQTYLKQITAMISYALGMNTRITTLHQ